MLHHAGHGEGCGDHHDEGGWAAADGTAHYSDGQRLGKGQQNDERDGADEVHQQVNNDVDKPVLQDAARAGGVEQHAQTKAEDAGNDQGGRDHDEGVDDGIGERGAKAVPVGLGEVGDGHRAISSIWVVVESVR